MIWLLTLVIFVASSTTIAVILCDLFSFLTVPIAIISLVTGIALSGLTFFKFRKNFPKLKVETYPQKFIIFFFLLFIFRHFLWLIFEKGNSVLVIDTSNFGDLPRHINYIQFLCNHAHFWPQNPLIINDLLTYPFGMDLFTALFSKLGVPYLNSLPVMGFIAGLCLLIALYAWGGAFAVGAALFTGGGTGYLFFTNGVFKDYQEGLAWGSVIIRIFFTQRGFLYALPAGILLLWSWRRRFFSNEKPLPVYVEGLIWGTMPLFHIHTFMFLSFLYAFWVLTAQNLRTHFKTYFSIFAWAVLPATYEVLRVTNNFHQASLIWFKPGWMIENQNIFMFFWNNYGLYVPLALGTLYLSFRKNVWRQILPAALIYFICLFVMFAPWDWDNTKLMIWTYILALPLMYELGIRALPKLPRAILIIALFTPDFIALTSLHDANIKGYEIYARDTVDAVCEALKSTPAETRIATAQVNNHPVTLCGHAVVAGYAGTLWAMGFPHADVVVGKLKRMMEGDPQWRELAQELHARYIYWGPSEQADYPSSSKPWEKENVKILAQGEWGKIFDLDGK